MPIDVQVPRVKWSMLEWHSNERKPKNDERVLMDCGGEVVVGRYVDGSFVSRSWGHTESDVRLWARGRKLRNGKPTRLHRQRVVGLPRSRAWIIERFLLLILFLGGFLVDVIKDIIERIKKK
jgi:hypothetical protein